jgi:hypothetical protein
MGARINKLSDSLPSAGRAGERAEYSAIHPSLTLPVKGKEPEESFHVDVHES